MSKIKLPEISTKPTQTRTDGLVTYGAGVPGAGQMTTAAPAMQGAAVGAAGEAADASSPTPPPYEIHDVASTDASLGLKAAPTKEELQQGLAQAPPAVAQTVAPAVPENYTLPHITLPTKDVARLDEMSRTMLELRGEVTHAQGEARKLWAAYQVLRDMVEAGVKLPRELTDLPGEVATIHKEILQTLGSRLDAVDATISQIAEQHGVVHASKPMLRLRPVRPLGKPAEQKGAAVLLFYNPRQGLHGADEQEFTLREQPRPVSTGYCVDVPDGYVCDVFVGADAVASLQGRGETELVVQLRAGKGAIYGRHIGGGYEIARLTLRKMEALSLRVEALQASA